MVAQLYAYTPKQPADSQTLTDGVRQVIANQDDGETQEDREATVLAACRASGFDLPDGYLAEEGVFGLPTGGPLATDGDIRVFARDEVADTIA